MIKNRKISWLELFYDLIFAVVFSRLTESLLEHQTLTGFINAILTFFWLILGWGASSVVILITMVTIQLSTF